MPFVLLFIKKRKGTADFVKRQSSEYCHPKHAFMITLFYENDKLFNQDIFQNYLLYMQSPPVTWSLKGIKQSGITFNILK